MKKLKNKGAALVAVLIGVLFITILASSLLYMSTMNYQMKGMRYSSTDNFYTAEFAMEDMLAQLRQKTEMHVDTVTTLAELKEILDPQIVDGHKVFNEQKLRNLIHISGTDYDGNSNGPVVVEGLAGVKVSTIYREKHADDSPWKDYGAYTYDTYEETAEGIILHGVKITVTTMTPEGMGQPLTEDNARKYANYESSISFDLEFAFPKYATTKSGSVSDFSILSDTPVLVGGGNHVFTGSLYARANGNTTIGATNAFKVGSKAVCTVAGSFAFFQGNLVVEDGGTLFISGNCYVNGNVRLGAKSTLYVAGNLKVRGSITDKSRLRATGDATPNDTSVDWDHFDDKYADGLAAKVAVPNIHLFVGTDANGITGYGGDKTNLTLTPSQFRTMCGDANVSDFYSSTTIADGRTVRAILSMASTNNTVEYDNALVIGFNNVNIHGKFNNSTFINLGRYPDGSSGFTQDLIELDEGLQAHPNTWGHMDDKTYAAACDLLFCYGAAPSDTKTAQITGSGYNVAFPQNGLLASDIQKDTSLGADTKAYTLGSLKLREFGNEGATDNIKFYRSESPVGSTYVNYFPYGNFLSDKMGEVMDDFMGACAGGSSGGGTIGAGFDEKASPTLIITHWTKE